MNDKEIQKNILDLNFKLQYQFMNTSLIMLTGGLLTFISTFIWFKERMLFGIGLSILIILAGLIMYYSAKKKIRKILKNINNLKE